MFALISFWFVSEVCESDQQLELKTGRKYERTDSERQPFSFPRHAWSRPRGFVRVTVETIGF